MHNSPVFMCGLYILPKSTERKMEKSNYAREKPDRKTLPQPGD